MKLCTLVAYASQNPKHLPETTQDWFGRFSLTQGFGGILAGSTGLGGENLPGAFEKAWSSGTNGQAVTFRDQSLFLYFCQPKWHHQGRVELFRS